MTLPELHPFPAVRLQARVDRLPDDHLVAVRHAYVGFVGELVVAVERRDAHLLDQACIDPARRARLGLDFVPGISLLE